MTLGSLIRSTWLLYFSQPAPDRSLYRAIKGKPIRSVVEIGIGNGLRTQRIWDVLSWRKGNLPVRYTGIDQFEDQPDSTSLTLKAAFRELRHKDVQRKLVPGDPHGALLHAANSLTGTDLLVISANLDQASLARAWIYIPRMLHPGSLIFQEHADPASGKASYQPLKLLDVQRLAAAASRAQRRAA